MSRPIRLTIFLIMLAAFAVSAPAILLYTKGYDYNFLKTRIEKTGILRVETIPSGATIELNGNKVPETTPTSFFRLLPGPYDVRLTREGMLPWSKTLMVESGNTTFATGIRLLRADLPELRHRLDAATAVFDAAAGKATFVRQDDQWTELGVIDAVSGAVTILARTAATDTATDRELLWSPEGTRLLVHELRDGLPAATVYAMDGSAPVRLRTGRTTDALVDIRWSAEDALLGVTRAGIGRIDATDGAWDPLVDGTGFTAAIGDGQDVYVLRRTGPVVAVERVEGATTRHIVQLPEGGDRVIAAAAGRLLVADTTRGTMTYVDARASSVLGTYAATHARAEGSPWSRIVAWSDFELFTIEPANGSRALLTRLSTPITDARPLPDAQTVVYSTASRLTAIEQDGRYGHVSYDLAHFGSIDGFGLVPDGSALRFFGAITHQRGVYERGL